MSTREIIHVMPTNDVIEHEPENCVCQPDILAAAAARMFAVGREMGDAVDEGTLHFAHNALSPTASQWAIAREVDE